LRKPNRSNAAAIQRQNVAINLKDQTR